MRKFVLGLTVTLLLFVGCATHSTAPQFVKYDKVEIVRVGNDRVPEDEPMVPSIGIVTRQEYDAGYVYYVEFADGTTYRFREYSLRLIKRFSFEKE